MAQSYSRKGKLFKEAETQAEEVVILTMDESRNLGGFLGKIVPACFEHRDGWYAAVVDGKKTLYLQKGRD